LRDEIQYSPSEVARLLRPLAGPIAKGIVSSTLAGFARSVRSTVVWVGSPWRWFRSTEGAAKESLEQGDLIVTDILVIHRATGLLVLREPIGSDPSRAIDADFVVEATAAIVSFVRRAYSQSENGGPAVLSFGNRNWLVRAGGDGILAASYSGHAPTGLARRFDSIAQWLENAWGRELRQFAGPLPVDRERAMCRDMRSKMLEIAAPEVREAAPTFFQQAARWLLVLAVVIGIGLFAIWRVDAYRSASVDEAARSVIEGHPDLLGYPIEASFDRSTNHVKLVGLLPDRQVAEDVVNQLSRSTGYPVVRMFGIVSPDRVGADGRPLNEVIADLGANVRSLGQDVSVLSQSVAESEGASADWRRVQSRRVDRLAAQVAPALTANREGTGSALADWGAENLIRVDLDARSVDLDQLQSLRSVSRQLAPRQFVGLSLAVAPAERNEADERRALQLVLEQLVRVGIDDQAIVERATAEAVVNQASGQGTFLVRLEIIDLGAPSAQ
ncbi:MAG: hypothetical protein AAGF58_13290, partial [Pseudomonadota bacterium]